MTANPTDRQAIDDLKARVDLVALLGAHGVQVKKEGRGYKACCPWHEDKTPSLSVDVKKGLYHCFSCGKSGDSLSFLESFRKLPFPQALEELRKFTGPADAQPQVCRPQDPFPFDLLARVAEVWHQAFCQRPEGLAYLESRGLKDKEMLRLFEVGYCDGEQMLAITNAQERESLQRVGILNEGGKELFSRCVVFPLKDKHGRAVGFYGRGILPRAKVPHRFCAGAKTGLFYPQAARGAQRVFLVEGVLDALALYQAGFTNVMALGGTQGLTAAVVDHLKAEKVGELVLCLDGDGPGQVATAELAGRLQTEGFCVRAVGLPDGQDPLSWVPGRSQSELEGLFSPGPGDGPLEPAASQEIKRSYRKLSAAQGKLKVLVSLSWGDEKVEATVDLYSSRSRRQEAFAIARRLGLDIQEIEDWLLLVLRELEESKKSGESLQELFGKVEVPPMTAQQRQVAMDFLQRPDLVMAILNDMELLGYVGEDEAKLLGYCVSVSRKLEKPMSAIIQSGSGAGKSYLAKIIQSMTPPEDVVFYSRLSPQALYHMPKDYLVHKMLMLEERIGGESCDYQIRTLQSSDVLLQAIVVKDPATGQLFTRENEVRGPIAYLETTTNLRLNPENTSRCFEIPLDESPEQTRRIHERQKSLRSLEGLSMPQGREAVLQRHHDAQRLLESVPVVIPFVQHLTFPDRWLRSRRDHDRFMSLIEVLAYLHQYQRPRKRHNGLEYIEATPQDYRWAYFLAAQALQGSLDEMSRWARELLTFFEANPLSYTRRELRERLQWPDRRTRESLEELADLEYLEVSRGSNNLLTFRLSSIKGSKAYDSSNLLHPDELEARWNSV